MELAGGFGGLGLRNCRLIIFFAVHDEVIFEVIFEGAHVHASALLTRLTDGKGSEHASSRSGTVEGSRTAAAGFANSSAWSST